MSKTILISEPHRDHRIVVRASPIHRWGLYAQDVIPPYTILEEAPYFAVPKEQVDVAPECERYTYWLSDTHLLIGMGFAGLYNHSSTPNAAYEIDYINELIRHYTIKEIDSGKEITIDYGPENIKAFNLID